MTQKDITRKIQEALQLNELEEAQKWLDEGQALTDQDATLHFLQGKLFMKRSEWSKAISSFLRAEELEPDGPARECRLMLNYIMDFYNKDMYNQ